MLRRLIRQAILGPPEPLSATFAGMQAVLNEHGLPFNIGKKDLRDFMPWTLADLRDNILLEYGAQRARVALAALARPFEDYVRDFLRLIDEALTEEDAGVVALENPSKANIGFEEKIAGENALKHWVLSRGWQQARYLHEPKNKISHESAVWRHTEACEELASIDKGFRERFGDIFYRQDAVSAPVTPKKLRTTSSANLRKRKVPHLQAIPET
ncbi:hypothetical protein BO79DRAFT_219778 [Aspergillus costaricaensis CBS 115574]|uniref:Uncharacterized protein n=1 Tax=Aspergillus costaricaensis CBS 115574 TaxID=1448317 RepID=A0ACD1I9I6_9EURO|nr:hypothetical protein BO79DRAFT_219778 [Aspergillus costaricaensis CBS 115574]RAK86437.1 hypothetical protein BO79DRAFT_219778 [Aspergillus costaricaensis CBS 115574]